MLKLLGAMQTLYLILGIAAFIFRPRAALFILALLIFIMLLANYPDHTAAILVLAAVALFVRAVGILFLRRRNS